MKAGPKPDPVSRKLARGTYRPDRDANTWHLATASDPPQMPDHMTPLAQTIWTEEVGRVMQAGVAELDSTLFANYCSLASLIRMAFSTGQPPPAAHLAELRRHAELLGIAGPKSRTVRPGTPADNPFANNGVRPAEGASDDR